MAKITITGVHPFDGEYDLDPSRFTGDELHTIKKISGVRGRELREALEAGDYDVIIAFVVIALQRAGRTVDPAQLLAAEVGAISIDLTPDEQEVEDRPPASQPPNGPENKTGGNGGESGNTTHSGGGSRPDGGEPPSRPSLTGLHGLADSADSVPETLAS